MLQRKMYVVENFNNNEYLGFNNIKSVREFMIEYYKDNFEDWYRDYDSNSNALIALIKQDLDYILSSELPHIEDVLYTREVLMME